MDFRKILKKDYSDDNEIVRLRKLNFSRYGDLNRLIELDNSRLVQKYIVRDKSVKEMSEEELVSYKNGTESGINIAIEGELRYVGEDTAGKLQGILFVYQDEPLRVERLIRNGWIVPKSKDFVVVDFGYAKHPGAKHHQIASSVRLFIKMIGEEFVGMDIFLVAYIDKENDNSVNLVKTEGFELKGVMVYDSEQNTENDYVYIKELK